ncbi:MAG TPA: thiamine pyrophosphate-binding protein, partial [Polyangiaceae bacterium]|nr:thiamine pyrophosphate-binding protein [Polyangiaceae bacterium]
MSGAPSSPATLAARVLLSALVDLGVREVVLAPGSRSAPLAYALAEAALAPDDPARDPQAPVVDLHVRVDEREAGFLALGLARAARLAGDARPVAVVTTSGSAVAHLLPAVLEAHHSGVPLLLLTADRPHELRGTGANQTTQQPGLLGPVRLAVDVPAPVGLPDEPRTLRNLASRAVAAALGTRTRQPGPVHLDLAYREPLVPGPEAWPAPSREGITRVDAAAPSAAPELARGPRTLVVAGDGAGPAAADLAEQGGWPLLAEPSSGSCHGPQRVGAYRLVLGASALTARVERVVVTLCWDQDGRDRMWHWTTRTLHKLRAVLGERMEEVEATQAPPPETQDRAAPDLTPPPAAETAASECAGSRIAGTNACPALADVWNKVFHLDLPVATAPGGLHVIAACGRHAELTAVAARIKRLLLAGAAPGSIAVLARSMEGYRPAIARVFAQHGIPLAAETEP